MKMSGPQPEPSAVSVGSSLETAISALLRWSTRPEVRRLLLGGVETALSPTDVWLLERIAETGPVRLSDLASWQGVDKSTMTPQAQRLLRQELIERMPDPSDGRAVLITITPRGEAVRTARHAAARDILDDLVSGWADDDRRRLATLLERLVRELPISYQRRTETVTGGR